MAACPIGRLCATYAVVCVESTRTTGYPATVMRPHGILGDHVVLQRDKPISLRGWAAPGATITATLDADYSEAVVQADGRWQVALPARPAGGPFEVAVESAGDVRRFVDVLVGDVYLCAGQSNMAMLVSAARDAECEIANANDSDIRVARVDDPIALAPTDDLSARWTVCSPQTAGNFSAASYFFAREMRRRHDVPIGLVVAARGHTPCESWMPRDAFDRHPTLRPLLAQLDEMLSRSPDALHDLSPHQASWNAAMAQYEPVFMAWYTEALNARREGKSVASAPARPVGIANPHNPTVLYNGLIAPLVGLPMAGMLWYQGETNAIFGTGLRYRDLFAALAQSWRSAWGIGDFPIIYAQIASHDDVQCEPADELWPQIREAQRRCAELPNTAMIVTIDIGETSNIHPVNKQAVGRRFALAADALVHGRDVAWSGPLFSHAAVRGGEIVCTFQHADGGLELLGDGGFEVTADGSQWHAAHARVQGTTLALRSDRIAQPRFARYAWRADPSAVLFGRDGLPASPFVTCGRDANG